MQFHLAIATGVPICSIYCDRSSYLLYCDRSSYLLYCYSIHRVSVIKAKISAHCVGKIQSVSIGIHVCMEEYTVTVAPAQRLPFSLG